MARARVLLIEDDAVFRSSLAAMIRRLDFEVVEADSVGAARASLAKGAPDIVVLDLSLPDGDGLDLQLEEGFAPGTPFVVVSGDAATGTARRALKQGAVDYLTKPVDPVQLRTVLHSIRRGEGARRQLDQLNQELRNAGRFGELVGRCGAMQRVYELIARVAPTDASTLITGESGTGKEVVARTIHQRSSRAEAPFIAINCGAIPETLIESELFGHAKGSFTGATERKEGVFERADGGTLFLDEIGEMPMELQVRLLRVLETGQLTPIGGSNVIDVDVRVLAATNRDPGAAVGDGRLREDLFFRLSVFPIHLPPLRERGEDVVHLANHVLDALNAEHGVTKYLPRDVRARLLGNPWKGNVRELKNAIERAWILAETEIRADDLCPESGGDAVPAVPGGSTGMNEIRVPLGTTIADAERTLIEATLAYCDGNKRKTARVLGVSVKTLYNRLNVYEDTVAPVATD